MSGLHAAPNAVRPVASASLASIYEALQAGSGVTSFEEVARVLAGISDDAFTELVLKEARGELPAQAAEIFGHPVLAHRWAQTVKALILLARNHNWPAWLCSQLVLRRAAAAHAVTSMQAQRRATRDTPTPRSLATDRLIKAHPEEFGRYLAEERASAIGTPA